MGKKLDELLATNTREMGFDELKKFFQEDLIPTLNQEWGEGEYLFMMCDSDDIVLAKICEECGLPKPGREQYFSIGPKVMESDSDLEELFDSDDYDDNGYGFPMARNVDDCMCEDDDE